MAQPNRIALGCGIRFIEFGVRAVDQRRILFNAHHDHAAITIFGLENRLLLLGHKPFDFGILISQIGHRTDLDHIAHLSLSYPYFIIILVKSKRLWKFHHEE